LRWRRPRPRHEALDEGDCAAEQSAWGAAELGIVEEMQVLDDRPGDILGLQDFDLAVDQRGIDRRVDAQGLLRLKQLNLVGVDVELSRSGVFRLRGQDVDCGDRKRRQYDREHRRPLKRHRRPGGHERRRSRRVGGRAAKRRRREIGRVKHSPAPRPKGWRFGGDEPARVDRVQEAEGLRLLD
jgi:hypothetical protein